MRFKEYLVMEAARPSTSGLEETQAYEWMLKHAPRHLATIFSNNDAAIFRGVDIDLPDFQHGDSRTFTRTAANTTNQLNLLVSSSDRWKEYPRRQKSFICTSSATHAGSYGDLYLVVPADKNVLGICPRFDFWICFNNGFEGTGINRINKVNYMLNIGLRFASADQLTFSEKDESALRQSLREMTLEKMQEIASSIKYLDSANRYIEPIATMMAKLNIDNLEDYLEHALDPQANGFTHTSVGAYNGVDAEEANGHELWFSGEAIFIKLPKGAASNLPLYFKELESKIHAI